ncbi:MAG: hypothetical protein R3222_03715 [Balneolaceae bacterium]|nr:hypothetical protein [Balneolaceae bacterium]
MLEQYHIEISSESRQSQVLNAILAFITGLLTLIYPEFLYLIAGSYLLVLGIIFIAFKVSPTLSALPIVTGLLIFIFPDLIPYTIAGFLGLFGFLLLFAFQFAVIGVITLVISLLVFMNPGSIAYLVATFLLLYAVSDFIRYYQKHKE